MKPNAVLFFYASWTRLGTEHPARLRLRPSRSCGTLHACGSHQPVKPRTAIAALVIIAGLASGCTAGGDMAGNLPTQVKAWVGGSGMDTLDARLNSDGVAMVSAVATHSLTQLKTACAATRTDASQANSALPTPEQQLTNDLSLAYAHYYDAGQGCLEQKGSIASGAFSAYLIKLEAAKRAIIKAQAEVVLVEGS